MVAKIQTVLGEVLPERLGRTLTHEHLYLDLTWAVNPPPTHLKEYVEGLITLQNSGFVHQYPYQSNYNLALFDHDTQNAQFKELEIYRKSGGLTIVENSCHGLGRRADLMKNISEKTKVNIVAGTGFYLSCTQKENTLNLSVQQLCDVIRKDLKEGCSEDPSVKCGFVGEVGCSWPIDAFEKKSILATAAIQEELNCPVSFHPGHHPDAPFEVIRIHLEAGGRKDKTVMSHLDSVLTTEAQLLDFAELGTFCQFDLFGCERSFYVLDSDWEMPSDSERLERIKHMIGKGLLDRILISQDIHSKHRMVEFGGHGYCHINYNVIPKMKRKGMTQEEIDHITIKNPARWLSF